ncbi:hypothetical protein E7X23_26615, partial [Bacteroides fragilis]
SGLARERYHMDGEYPAGGPEIVTSGGSGFGIMAILAGIDLTADWHANAITWMANTRQGGRRLLPQEAAASALWL